MQADRTVSIGERAVELMRQYGRCASPRAYEVWYTFVTGLKPQLNEAVKRMVTARGTVTSDECTALFEEHLSNERLLAEAERTGDTLIVEMTQVSGLLGQALGSAERYGESLRALSDGLDGPIEGARLKGILESLVATTRDVASTNQALENRLRDSRSEIESLREALDEVRQETLLDALTGIANRRHFDRVLMNAVEAARRDDSPLALVVIDIDEFKRFNDLYGHLTGDQVLRLVANAMRENVTSTSTLARFGGEEFAMLLPGMGADGAFAVAETIRQNVMGRELLKRSTGESLGRVTISLGIATIRAGDTALSLLERADSCMYQAKRSGRNRTMADRGPGEASLPDAA